MMKLKICLETSDIQWNSIMELKYNDIKLNGMKYFWVAGTNRKTHKLFDKYYDNKEEALAYFNQLKKIYRATDEHCSLDDEDSYVSESCIIDYLEMTSPKLYG